MCFLIFFGTEKNWIVFKCNCLDLDELWVKLNYKIYYCEKKNVSNDGLIDRIIVVVFD